MFNLIDTEEGVKADLVPLTREPGYRAAFARRVRHTFSDETGQPFEAWCAQPTDIIIGKLRAWVEGRSLKHPADIQAMLVFALSGLGTETIDLQAIALEAARLGPEAPRCGKRCSNTLKTRCSEDLTGLPKPVRSRRSRRSPLLTNTVRPRP